MKRFLRALVLGVVALPAAAAASDVATEPKPGLTVGEARAAFANAVMMSCFGALKAHAPIADLDPVLRQDLRPATDAERQAAPFKVKTVPIWVSQALGSHLHVAETSPTRCDIVADQLPVETTFQVALAVVHGLYPDWRDVPQKPGYDPIVHQVEGDADGAHYVVHLEGAEPGAFGHAMRFSLLVGWVTRTP